MNLKPQTIAVIHHFGLLTPHAKEATEDAKCNKIKTFYAQESNCAPPETKLHYMNNPDKPNTISTQSLKLFEQIHRGTIDTYFFGPAGTSLWLALIGKEDAATAMYDLSLLLGVQPAGLKEISNEHLLILAYYYPDFALFIFAYEIYMFKLMTGHKKVSTEELKLSTTSLDIYFEINNVAFCLELYGLNRDLIFELITNDSWYISKGEMERMFPISEIPYFSSKKGFKTTISGHLSFIDDDMKRSGSTDIFSEDFYNRYIEPISVHWEPIHV